MVAVRCPERRRFAAVKFGRKSNWAAARSTMREVAALAGVSLKTVSRVVNREPGVSAELVGKVEQTGSGYIAGTDQCPAQGLCHG